MPIAARVEWYLGTHGVHYELIPHAESATASATQLAPESVAKAIVLSDEHGYLLAVLPASRAIDLPRLCEKLHRHLGPAASSELHHIFIDCDCDCVPAVGVAYGVPTVVDRALFECDDLYMEGGDPRDLLHLSRGEFERLMARAERASISLEPPPNQAAG